MKQTLIRSRKKHELEESKRKDEAEFQNRLDSLTADADVAVIKPKPRKKKKKKVVFRIPEHSPDLPPAVPTRKLRAEQTSSVENYARYYKAENSSSDD